MRAVIQRVCRASVTIGGIEKGRIPKGLLILLGIEISDDQTDVDWLAGKIERLRIFADHDGIMNLSIQDVNGSVLIVSQFTLHASTKKGNRPAYIRAAPPEAAIPLYEKFIRRMKSGISGNVETGEFGAMMQVELVNDGPVTIIIDTKMRE
ncbi:MAG: D-aminoacyl-tRNA deacylase [Bacteroidales bacterium]